ncbi:MAG TPA: hypothetical protein VNP92_30215 [Actinophytocola sp.]|nr:hypothetical protein [Actinophytocola sp.]
MANSETYRRLALPGVCLGMTVAVLAPLLGRGFVLGYDMVFAPRQYLVPDAVGLGSALPRSVPADAVVALLTTVVPGDLVQQLVLAAALFVGPLGAGLLVPTGSLGVRLVAAVSYGWSAYVAERLFIGHWPYLLTYACLPWIARAAIALRATPNERATPDEQATPDEPRQTRKRLAVLVLTMAPAVLTPSGGIIAAGTAMVTGGARRLWLTATLAVVLNSPWWVPALLHPGTALSTSDGVAAFGARAESWAGAVVSLLGTGGIWNAEVVPDSRANPVVPVLVLAMVAVAAVGLHALWKTPAKALVPLGIGGLALAALGGSPVLGWIVENVPGGGLLRDSQKWVAWWALPFAIGFALGVGRAAALVRRGGTLLLVGAAVIPVAMMPDLAWGGWGRLQPADYPADWAQVRERLAGDEPGDVLTLPLSAFRQFGWNGDRTQLDPAPRVLPRPTVVDDTLVVDGRPIAGEDPRAAAIRQKIADGGDLGDVGIGWLLVEHGTPGRIDAALLDRAERVHQGRWLDLYRIPGEIEPYRASTARVVPVVVADTIALATVTLSLLWLALPAGSLRPSRPRSRE